MAESNKVKERRPDPARLGKNGFSDSRPVSDKDKETAWYKEGEMKKRRLAEWILREKGSYFPT